VKGPAEARADGGRRPASFEFFEHDADIGLRVEAETLEELFAAAAEGMTAAMTEPKHVRARRKVGVGVKGVSLEEVLVNWLREWLYLYEGKRFVAGRFSVRCAGETGATGEGIGETRSSERHPAKREIKGVTWHQVRVEKVEGGWRAQVIFDV